jgi:Flp pilus assembly protein TadD
LGLAWYQSVQFSKALEPLGLVHDAHPDFFDKPAYLGFTLVRLGSFAAALDALRRANKLKSDQAFILSAIGTCLGKLGKTKQALANHERAVSLEPTSPELFVDLAGTQGLQTSRSVCVGRC